MKLPTPMPEKSSVFNEHGHGSVVLPNSPLSDIIQQEPSKQQGLEAALAEAEANLRALLNAPPESVFLMDPAGKVIAANETTCCRLHRTMSELLGRNIFDLLPKEVASQRREHVARVLQSKSGVDFEDTRDGRCMDNHIYPILNAQGEVARLVVFGFDITERKRTEESLRNSEERFRKLFQNHLAVKLIIDPETGMILDANEAAANFYGWSVAELRRMRIQQINTLSPEAVKGEMQKACVSQRTHFEFQHRRVDGSIRDVEVFSNQIETGGKCLLYSIIHDITDRKHLELELARNAARLQAIVETEPECVKIISPDGVLLEMNPAGLKMLEAETLTQVQSKPLLEYVNPNHHADFLELHRKVMQGQSAILEFEAIGLKGGRRWLATHAVPVREPGTDRINLLGVTRDITEQKRAESEREKLEAQNRQLQKAESLGRMAGAVAHHFNNQLQVVLMNLELAVRDMPHEMESSASLNEAIVAARKAAGVSSLMLTYLGQTPGNRELLDLTDTCRSTLSFMQALMPRNVSIETNLSEIGPVISADANQIQQVLTNLVTNAWESMGETQGAIRLCISSAILSDIAPGNRFPVDWRPETQSFGCLEVADNGCGIPAEEIPKICDPFYSSKFSGRGLGLAVVLGILRTHRGVMTVESEPKRGSVFRVYFPMVSDTKQKSIISLPSQPLAKGQIILVVEDEAPLRRVITVALKRLGFTVFLAQDGREALDIFEQLAGKVDLVLSDLVMPGMNGWQMLTALRKRAPNLPVILSSGYDESHAMEGRSGEKPQAFLGKPYTIKGLQETIISVLSRAHHVG